MEVVERRWKDEPIFRYTLSTTTDSRARKRSRSGDDAGDADLRTGVRAKIVGDVHSESGSEFSDQRIGEQDVNDVAPRLPPSQAPPHRPPLAAPPAAAVHHTSSRPVVVGAQEDADEEEDEDEDYVVNEDEDGDGEEDEDEHEDDDDDDFILERYIDVLS